MEMKNCAKCGGSKSITEFAPFKSGRYSYCRSCVKILNKIFYEKNKEREKARSKAYKDANPEKVKHWSEKWNSPQNEKTKIYRLNNSDKIKANGDRWRKENPDKARAIYARRRSKKLQATPIWANDFFIKEIYHLAKLREEICGGIWEVDHIVPLQSKLVCGLHCEVNLQVIPRKSNRKKANLYWPDMP